MLYPNIRYVNGSYIDTFKKEGDERNSKNLLLWIQQQPKNHSMQIPNHYMRRPIHKFLKKPKYKKSSKKIKNKYNNFSKRRRKYYNYI